MTSTKNSLKRPTTSRAGPVSKKSRIDKKTTKQIAKPSLPPPNDDLSSDSNAEEEDEEDDSQMRGDTSVSYTTVTNATQASRKIQRAIHDQRRSAKPHSTLLADAKRVWSLARQTNLKPAERREHIRSLMGIIRGNVKEIVLKHDASRIVQTVIKYGGPEERNAVAAELKGRYRDLVQNKYSKFLVAKLIRFCPAHRASILSEFQSHVMRLLLHREASGILADAFELYSNAYERTILLRDFYGKETALFSHLTQSDADKERARKGLKGVLEGLEAERRKRILVSVKDSVMSIFNNPDKGAVTHAIVHRALLEYLMETNDCLEAAEGEKLWREMFECCQDVLAEMVHTRDGSRVVREFIARGTAKDRKHILKAIKPHVLRMCTDEEAQLVLFTALDVIDDTKLTAKSIVQDIVINTSSLYTSPQGRRAIFYLLVPRTKRHFTASQISALVETDGLRAQTSKKDDHLRADEVRTAASEGLLAFVAEKGSQVCRDTGGSLIITEIMLYANGDKAAAMEVLLKALSTPCPSKDPSSSYLIDLPHTSRMYKILLQGGHFSKDTNSVSRAPSFSPAAFASAFLKIVGRDVTVQLAQSDGAFVVAELCERIHEEGTEEEKKCLKGWFEKSIILETIEASRAKGTKVLLGALEKLHSSDA